MALSSVTFTLSSFLAAALLFLLEPMVAKALLPTLGGAPGVWNTSVLFFQSMLLAGYALAHLIAIKFPHKKKLMLSAIVYVGVLVFLPLDFDGSAVSADTADAQPIVWLLRSLTLMAGVPFLVISTAAPTIQNWYASGDRTRNRDPYELYAASNLGGLLGLAAYPFLVEPAFDLTEQGRLWSWGYRIFFLLMFTNMLLAWVGKPRKISQESVQQFKRDRTSLDQVLRWIFFGFLPSSLLVGVTTYLSTDLAAIPLLWIVPLVLYQLSFVLVFSVTSRDFDLRCRPLVPILVGFLALSLGFGLVKWWLILFHLLGFFLVAVVCHGRLARERPDPEHLTGFYLSLCLGGVLGGLFNSLAAPVIFDRIVEYPLVLVGSLFALPGGLPRSRADWILPSISGLSIAFVVTDTSRFGDSLGSVFLTMLAIGLICLCFRQHKKYPGRYALAVAFGLLASGLSNGVNGELLYRERSFFGTMRVTTSDDGAFRRFFHGSTLHGIQSLDPEQRREPLAYFTRSGPFGEIFGAFRSVGSDRDVAIVGLGVGAMACYAEPGQVWTYYELDPAVARVATNRDWFTFIGDCRADRCDIVLGDARLRLREASDRSYGLIVLDAFSSDAVPVHLLTREALELYQRKLADHGLIAFQITNRYLNLEPVIGALAADAGWSCRVAFDPEPTVRETMKTGRQGSIWAVMAKEEADLAGVANNPRWRPALPAKYPWSDRYTNILDALVKRL